MARTSISSKTRKHSGRITSRIILETKKKDIVEQCLEPQVYWNEWQDYRDGFRGNNDRKQVRSRFMTFAENFSVNRWNNKLKRLIARRKSRKPKKLSCN